VSNDQLQGERLGSSRQQAEAPRRAEAAATSNQSFCRQPDHFRNQEKQDPLQDGQCRTINIKHKEIERSRSQVERGEGR